MKTIEELTQELASEKAAREKAEHIAACNQTEIEFQKQRAEAAEARIKASQKQKIYGYFANGTDGTPWLHTFSIGNGELSEHDLKNGFTTTKLYKQPIIPPELEELQRDLQDLGEEHANISSKYISLERENAELTRKLAEQQALLVKFSEWYGTGSIYGTSQDAFIGGKEELNKLLSERSAPEDTARLNWLESRQESLFTVWHDAFCPVTDGTNRLEHRKIFDGWSCGTVMDEHKSARAAIDAAMLSAQPKEQTL